MKTGCFVRSLLVPVAALPFWFRPALAADESPWTEVIVIGTIHKATVNFTKDDLVRILGRLNPAAILFEVDSSFLDKQSARLLPQYQKMTLEAEAVTAFLDKSKVPLLAYDLEGRNQIYKDRHYFELQKQFSEDVESLSGEDKLGTEARLLLEGIVALDNMRDAFGADRPEVVNSASCDAVMERKQTYDHAGVRKIIDLTPALSRFKEFARFDEEFWDERNQTMARNILNRIKDFSGKRVVVLCGFEHRYYLVRLLRANESKLSFRLREYRDVAPE